MRVETELVRNNGLRWVSSDKGDMQVNAKGYAFYRGEYHDAARLAEVLAVTAAESGLERLVSVVAQLNGSFAVV